MDDPLLRRLERNAAIACVVMAVGGAAFGGWRGMLGVLGGGILAAVSYGGIAAGVSALAAAAGRAAASGEEGEGPSTAGEGSETGGGKRRPRPAAMGLVMVKVVGRYALLILLAYVMIARLRLHPLGVVAGVSSVVAAAGVEAVRILVKKS